MKQQNIIILCHSFPPENNISGRRAYLFANYLAKHEHNITVITSKNSKRSDAQYGNFKIIEADPYNYKTEKHPLKKMLLYFYSSTRKWNWLNKIVRNLLFFLLPIDFDIKFQIPKNIEEQLSKTDCIIATSPPWYIFGDANKLASKLNSKLILDYRDSWTQVNKSKIRDVNDYGKLHGIKNIRYKKLEKKWLKKADLITAVSQHILNSLPPSINCDKMTILNGYQLDAEKNYKHEKKTDKTVYLTYTGKIYKEQINHFNSLLKAISSLYKKHELKGDFIIQLVGVKNSGFELVKKTLDQYKNLHPKINVTERIDKEEVFRIQMETDFFINFSYKDAPKVYGTKIFEYIAFPNPILHITSDQNDYISQVIEDTNSGYICLNTKEIETTIIKLFREISEGHLTKKGSIEKVKKYSFENQIQDLITYLK